MSGLKRCALAALTGALGLTGGFGYARAFIDQPGAEASHAFTYGGGLDQHIGSLHGAADDEEWCVEVWGGSWTQPVEPYLPGGAQDTITVDPPITSQGRTVWQDKVADSLNLPNPGIDWDNFASGRVDFTLLDGTKNCLDLTNRGPIDVEYWLFGPYDVTPHSDIDDQRDACSKTWDAGEPDRPFIPACAIPLYGYDNLDGTPPHKDFAYYRVAIDQWAVTGPYGGHPEQQRYRNNINHETGHVLGLNDCGGVIGQPPCNSDSIMHSSTWYNNPTAADRTSVTSIADRAPCPGPTCP